MKIELKTKGKNRIALALLCAALLLGGCVPRGAVEEEGWDDNGTDLTVIGFSQTGAESDWRVANSESMKAAFTEADGYELLFDDAQQRQENQIRAIRNFIQQQVDYIVFSPLTENGWDEVLGEAREAGIPVIVTDRCVRVEDEGLYTAYVGSDFMAEGDAAAVWLEKTLAAQGRTQEELTIVELRGTVDSSPQIGRSKGLLDAAQRHPNWVLANPLEGEFTVAKGYDVVQQYLKENAAPDILICQNDDMAAGAMQAMDEVGIAYGTRPGQVMLLSFDATEFGLQACLDGKIAFDAECNPLQGSYVKKVIEQLEAGETPDKNTYVAETSFAYNTIHKDVLQGRDY